MNSERGHAHIITIGIVAHALLAIVLWYAGNWTWDFCKAHGWI
jgi:hypothetical protein